jgi:uncharacterized membrane-anchored protein YjiN (DUF445 family)
MKNPKLAHYYYNRNIAHGLLVASAGVLILCIGLELAGWDALWLDLLGFFAEAILVASVADFIAITALSHEIPIPGMRRNTGLISKKRQALIRGISESFRRSLLPKELLQAQLQGLEVAPLLELVQRSELLQGKGDRLAAAIASVLRENKRSVSHFTANLLIGYISTMDSGKLIAGIHQTARARGWLGEIVQQLFAQVEEYVSDPGFCTRLEKQIGEIVESQSGGFLASLLLGAAKMTNTVNFEEMAVDTQKSLLELLVSLRTSREMASETNQTWQEMEHFFSQLIIALAHNQQVTAELDTWKSNVLRPDDLIPKVEKLVLLIAQWLEAGSLSATQAVDDLGLNLSLATDIRIDIHRWLAEQFALGVRRLAADDSFLQEHLQQLAVRFIDNEYDDVILIINEILYQLSNDDLVDKVKEVAGGSLQWLRISGAIVGGCAGLLIFLVIWWPLYFLPAFIAAVLAIGFIPPLRRLLVRYPSAEN